MPLRVKGVERTPQITVQLRQDVAERVVAEEAPSPAPEVTDVLERHGLTLVPVDPRAGDPTLRSFFRVDVPDEETVARLIEELNGLETVDAAYVQPPDALP